MPRETYVQKYEIEGRTIPGSWYRISIYWRGALIKEIVRPTMREAEIELERLGYEKQK